ncbi:YbaB/EbfC family nucleoid-associated protein [Actinopolymorpha alba]|uniref:YbaB/EbfC family nucleoid-associated protein n=1 Tax=Actinopolymorpha alba TaxID=533267 RepID=UPI00035F493A|nr:YbaB/EbfC family nucleoid-associated protein [Actinopolymorpha alba]
MSEFDDVSELFRAPHEIMRAHEEQLRKAEELQAKLQQLTGRAETDDGRISVSFSQANGIEDLTLDPRALRMPTEDLAAEIRRLVNEAREDVRKQSEALTTEAFAAGAPDASALVEQLPQLQEELTELLRDTQGAGSDLDGMVERMRRMFPGS